MVERARGIPQPLALLFYRERRNAFIICAKRAKKNDFIYAFAQINMENCLLRITQLRNLAIQTKGKRNQKNTKR